HRHERRLCRGWRAYRHHCGHSLRHLGRHQPAARGDGDGEEVGLRKHRPASPFRAKRMKGGEAVAGQPKAVKPAKAEGVQLTKSQGGIWNFPSTLREL